MSEIVTINHSIKVGEIIRTMGEQCAYAGPYEVRQPPSFAGQQGKYIEVAKASIRINVMSDTHVINTNWLGSSGVVCILPPCFEDCLILAVRVIRVFNKSVEAVPIDYIDNKEEIPFDAILTNGTAASKVLNYHQNAERHPHTT